ncbi:phosphoribulokinase [Enterovibrio norvegicus]|uniref:phosphoribulokinase n=2 Tax=Enterovibrio norvegicus TaxID=188144 RepID=UPI000C82D0AC|nr:phosphoribulokinase [Enterovibrio norvegicus]MCC4796997.1 phosphoribulokinase [Enterovibrio norvegicus]PMH65410.1 phosphoribulokinase [Enterovibrio norvegicus]PMI34353.1 phosphoribulokinase [Enterovibrio norvegicus]PMI40729.1 phosphoribulokinase [Enterovibrio norvegicus]PMN56384.1 phosphoribulokinase [Enterovibrio norvegicus]
MSIKHPIVAVTGSSGAGTSTVKNAMEQIFRRNQFEAAVIEGDSYHRFDRFEMRERLKRAQDKGNSLSHFGPEGNDFEALEKTFKAYAESGTAMRRYYIHNEEEAREHCQKTGTFSPWKPIPEGSDLLFYEGLHGGIVAGKSNVARFVDLLIGVVPIVNLEWIQKIHRDTHVRGYSRDAVTDTILRRMHDYVYYITPQFSLTDVNFQRVPMVDTSNPFIARDIPTLDESMVVIRFRDPKKTGVDFQYLLNMVHGSFMSRRNNIVVPGGKMGLAMELIMQPLIEQLVFNGSNRVSVATTHDRFAKREAHA